MAPVLVVEDDAATREMIASALQLDGIPVVTARDGHEGLERLRRHRPGLVLLDLMMPVMDGSDFRKAQLQDPQLCQIPTVLMTAAHDGRQHMAALRADGFIEKPYILEGVREAVNSYLVRRYQA